MAFTRGLVAAIASMTLMAVAGALPARAASQLDQSQTDFAWSLTVDSAQSVAQSFTAGMSGRLTSIDIYLARSAAFTASVTVKVFAAAANGTPTGVALATEVLSSGTFPLSGVGDYRVSVPLTSAPAVVAGSMYAYSIESPASGGNYYVAFNANPGAYAGGITSFCGPASCAWSPAAVVDLAFSTYVDPGDPESRDLTVWQKAYARASAEASCEAGWNPSWMQWPHGGTGGFVCIRNTYAYYPNEAYSG